ncbi:MAG: NHL repeat-containing protein [Candidatus Auribacterota bacterium]
MKRTILFLCSFFLISNSCFASSFYVTNRFDNRVLKVDTETNNVSIFAEDGLVSGPISLMFSDDRESLFVSNGFSGSIVEFDIDTGIGQTYASGFRPPHDMVFDASGYLYVSQPGLPGIARVSPDGTSTPFISGSGLVEPVGMVRDSSGNFLIANGLGGNVLKFDSGGNFVEVYLSGLSRPGFLMFDDENNLYVSDRSALEVIKYDDNKSVLKTFTAGLLDPLGIGLDDDGILYVADRTNNYIAKFNASGALVGTITSSLFNGPGVILFESDPVIPAVPEPATMLLLSSGCFFLLKRWKR